jgi:hypothetical protein
LALSCAAGRVAARDATPFAARGGLELASAAAQSWSGDAVLVYVENDEGLNNDAAGTSPRWSYLFYSAAQDRARVWSVRGGKIATAENLDMRFDAPPVAAGWLDSGAALAAAERAAAPSSGPPTAARTSRPCCSCAARSPRAIPTPPPGRSSIARPASPRCRRRERDDGKVQRTWRG